MLTWSLVTGVLFVPAVLSLPFLGRICVIREEALALSASVPGRRATSKKLSFHCLSLLLKVDDASFSFLTPFCDGNCFGESNVFLHSCCEGGLE